MTRTQKTVFILVAVVALILGLTVNKVLSGKGQGDPTALIDAGELQLPDTLSISRYLIERWLEAGPGIRDFWHTKP